MKIRALIVDDEPLARQRIRTLLGAEKGIEVVGECANGQEAVTGARETTPDLALLDVDMPKMDGIKAARLIAAVSPRTKILMLSVHHEDEKINAATRAGAIGYILKDTDRAEFINIIRQTHAGKISHSPYLAHLAVEPTSNRQPAASQARITQFCERFGLTELELKILRFEFPKRLSGRYVQIRTTESPSWVAWAEIELGVR